MANEVTGIDEAIRNLNAEAEKIIRGGRNGLRRAGFFVEGESKRLTPVDTGNLRASGYSRMDQGGRLAVEIGFTANYALWVHEMVEEKLRGQPRGHFGSTREGTEFGGGTGKGNYWDGGESKFLEKTLNRHDEILAAIVGEMRIP